MPFFFLLSSVLPLEVNQYIMHIKKHTHSYGHNKISNNKCLGPWLICSLVAWFIFKKKIYAWSLTTSFLSFFLCHFFLFFFLYSYFEFTRSISSIENSSNFRSQFNFLIATEDEKIGGKNLLDFPINLHTLTRKCRRRKNTDLESYNVFKKIPI